MGQNCVRALSCEEGQRSVIAILSNEIRNVFAHIFPFFSPTIYFYRIRSKEICVPTYLHVSKILNSYRPINCKLSQRCRTKYCAFQLLGTVKFTVRSLHAYLLSLFGTGI